VPGFANAAALAAIVDRYGNTITITRGTGPFDRRILQVSEPSGRSLAFTYDTAGRVVTVADPINRIVRYTYDAQGRLESVTNPAGGVTRYTYDNAHRLLTITDPLQITFVTNEYDPTTGRVIRQIQADGTAWTFAYTVTANIVTETRVTDPRGNTTASRFNSSGYLVSETDALGQTTRFDYATGSNLLLSITDPLGRTTRFTHDVAGSVISVADPEQNVRRLTYELTFGKPTSVTDPLGHTTTFEYDGAGNPKGEVYSRSELAKLLEAFTGLEMRIGHLQGYMLLPRIGRIVPDAWLRPLEGRWGFFLYAKGRNPAAGA